MTRFYAHSYPGHVIDQGVGHTILIAGCEALKKLELALNTYAKKEKTGRSYNFKQAIGAARNSNVSIDSRKIA